MVHGFRGDPRYPSPRTLRRTYGFVVDWIVHFGCGVAAYLATGTHLPTVWAVLAWLVASFVHRVLIQAACGTTLGKALFGLRIIRPSDGGRPTVGELARAWVLGVWLTCLLVVELAGSGSTGADVDEDRAFLPAVRASDLR
jgi:hypothetical protein